MKIAQHALLLPFVLFTFLSNSTQAAGAPRVGRNAAAKYFGGDSRNPSNEPEQPYRGDRRAEPSTIEPISDDSRFLTFGASTYVASDSYKWGIDTQKDVGKWGVDMTYRLGVIRYSFDEAMRISYNEFEVTGVDNQLKRASKMSFLYTLILPDAGTKFPLYFGAGVGPGIFFKQLENESVLSMDYQLFLGLRIFNLFDNAGFYVEGGLKNHLQILSDGQVNGSYVGVGGIFTF